MKKIHFFKKIIAKSNFTFFLSTITTTLILSLGLVISTYVSGFYKYNLEHPVDKQNCECGCWDGFFRGAHARKSKKTEYKVFYFNYDTQFIFILFIFLTYAEMLRNCLNKIFNIRYLKNVRILILINLILSIYSNYYGAWSLINYLNDRDYRMVNSQIFFSITELITSYIYYNRLNRFTDENTYNKVETVESFTILFVSLLHIFIAVGEKILWGFFVKNLSTNYNKVRDLNLIISDILGIFFSFVNISKNNLLTETNLKNLKNGILFTFFLYLVYKMLCEFKE